MHAQRKMRQCTNSEVLPRFEYVHAHAHVRVCLNEAQPLTKLIKELPRLISRKRLLDGASVVVYVVVVVVVVVVFGSLGFY